MKKQFQSNKKETYSEYYSNIKEKSLTANKILTNRLNSNNDKQPIAEMPHTQYTNRKRKINDLNIKFDEMKNLNKRFKLNMEDSPIDYITLVDFHPLQEINAIPNYTNKMKLLDSFDAMINDAISIDEYSLINLQMNLNAQLLSENTDPYILFNKIKEKENIVKSFYKIFKKIKMSKTVPCDPDVTHSLINFQYEKNKLLNFLESNLIHYLSLSDPNYLCRIIDPNLGRNTNNTVHYMSLIEFSAIEGKCQPCNKSIHSSGIVDHIADVHYNKFASLFNKVCFICSNNKNRLIMLLTEKKFIKHFNKKHKDFFKKLTDFTDNINKDDILIQFYKLDLYYLLKYDILEKIFFLHESQSSEFNINSFHKFIKNSVKYGLTEMTMILNNLSMSYRYSIDFMNTISDSRQCPYNDWLCIENPKLRYNTFRSLLIHFYEQHYTLFDCALNCNIYPVFEFVNNRDYNKFHKHCYSRHTNISIISQIDKYFNNLVTEMKMHFICAFCTAMIFGYSKVEKVRLDSVTRSKMVVPLESPEFRTIYFDNFRFYSITKDEFSNGNDNKVSEKVTYIGACKHCFELVSTKKEDKLMSIVNPLVIKSNYSKLSSINEIIYKEKKLSLIKNKSNILQKKTFMTYAHMSGKFTLRKQRPIVTNSKFQFFLIYKAVCKDNEYSGENKFDLLFFNEGGDINFDSFMELTKTFKNLFLKNSTYKKYIHEEFLLKLKNKNYSKINKNFIFNNINERILLLNKLNNNYYYNENVEKIMKFFDDVRSQITDTLEKDFMIIFADKNPNYFLDKIAMNQMPVIMLSNKIDYFNIYKEDLDILQYPLTYNILNNQVEEEIDNPYVQNFEENKFKKNSIMRFNIKDTLMSFFSPFRFNIEYIFYKYFQKISNSLRALRTVILQFFNINTEIGHIYNQISKSISIVEQTYPSLIPDSQPFLQKYFNALCDVIRTNGIPTLMLTVTSKDSDILNMQMDSGQFIPKEYYTKSYRSNYFFNTFYFKKRLNFLMKLITDGTVDIKSRNIKKLCPPLFGKVSNYYVRIEPQKKGTLHAHILLWIEDPNLDRINSMIVGNLPDDVADSQYLQLVFNNQMHFCNPHFCKMVNEQGEFICKSGFPKPMNDTLKLGKYNKVFPIRETLEDQFVNPYIPDLLRFIRSSMDIRFCDTAAIIAYLTKMSESSHTKDWVVSDLMQKLRLEFSANMNIMDNINPNHDAPFFEKQFIKDRTQYGRKVEDILSNQLFSNNIPITEAVLNLISGESVMMNFTIIFVPLTHFNNISFKISSKNYKTKLILRVGTMNDNLDMVYFDMHAKYLFRCDVFFDMTLYEYIHNVIIVPAGKHPGQVHGEGNKYFDTLGNITYLRTDIQRRKIVITTDKVYYTIEDKDFKLYALTMFWPHMIVDIQNIGDEEEFINFKYNELIKSDSEFSDRIKDYHKPEFENIIRESRGKSDKMNTLFFNVLLSGVIQNSISSNSIIQTKQLNSKTEEAMKKYCDEKIRLDYELLTNSMLEGNEPYTTNLTASHLLYSRYPKQKQKQINRISRMHSQMIDYMHNTKANFYLNNPVKPSDQLLLLLLVNFKRHKSSISDEDHSFVTNFYKNLTTLSRYKDIQSHIDSIKINDYSIIPDLGHKDNEIRIEKLFEELNLDQRKIFLIIYEQILKTEISSYANHGIFINGLGGSGKSFLIAKLAQVARIAGINLKILTPTNQAALIYTNDNIEASTIHSLLALTPSNTFLTKNKDKIQMFLSKLDKIVFEHKEIKKEFGKEKFLEFFNELGDKGVNRMQLQYGQSNHHTNEKLLKTNIFIIDEMSMISNELLLLLDFKLRILTQLYMAPFGGKFIILIGDIYQLPPVNAEIILNSHHISNLVYQNLEHFKYFSLKLEMTSSVRHADDYLYGKFCTLLRRKTFNEDLFLHDEDMIKITNMLESRNYDLNHNKIFYHKHKYDFVYLNQLNINVDNYNNKISENLKSEGNHMWELVNDLRVDHLNIPNLIELQRLLEIIHEDGVKSFRDYLWEYISENNRLVNKLQVCKGYKVRVVRNYNKEKGIVNGTDAIVINVYTNKTDNSSEIVDIVYKNALGVKSLERVPKVQIIVDISSDNFSTFTKEKYDMYSITKTRNVKFVVNAFPLAANYGMTIHKVQGSTLPFVLIDQESIELTENINYVAFSRCRTFSNLLIKNLNLERLYCYPKDKQDNLVEIHNISDFTDSEKIIDMNMKLNFISFREEVYNGKHNFYENCFRCYYGEDADKLFPKLGDLINDLKLINSINPISNIEDKIITKKEIAPAILLAPLKEPTPKRVIHKSKRINKKTAMEIVFPTINSINENNENNLNNFIIQMNDTEMTTKIAKMHLSMQEFTSQKPGLVNNGNTCFINSAIQFICYSNLLMKHVPDYRSSNWKVTNLINRLRKFQSVYDTYYLECILIFLQEDLVHYPENVPRPLLAFSETFGAKDIKQQDSSEFLFKFIEKYSMTESLKVNIKSQIACICKYSSLTEREEFYIYIDIINKTTEYKLVDCLDKLEKNKEKLFTYNCGGCGVIGKSQLKETIVIPLVNMELIFLVKRFYHDEKIGCTMKKQNKFTFPIILNFKNNIYKLNGFIEHFGTAESGHYAYMKIHDLGNGDYGFVNFSDRRVKIMEDKAVKYFKTPIARIETKFVYVINYVRVIENIQN